MSLSEYQKKEKNFGVLPFRVIIDIIGLFYEFEINSSKKEVTINDVYGYFKLDHFKKTFLIYRSFQLSQMYIFRKSRFSEIVNFKKVESLRLFITDTVSFQILKSRNKKMILSDDDQLSNIYVPTGRMYKYNLRGSSIPKINEFLKIYADNDKFYFVRTFKMIPNNFLILFSKLKHFELNLTSKTIKLLPFLPVQLHSIQLTVNNQFLLKSQTRKLLLSAFKKIDKNGNILVVKISLDSPYEIEEIRKKFPRKKIYIV